MARSIPGLLFRMALDIAVIPLNPQGNALDVPLSSPFAISTLPRPQRRPVI